MERKDCSTCKHYKPKPFANPFTGDVYDGYCKKNKILVTENSVCRCHKQKANK